MPDTAGRVTSIAINDHKVSFALDRKNNERFTLFSEAPNTKTIPQFELASHSWMLSILQTAFTTGHELKVRHDDERLVSQIEVHDPLKINPDVVGKAPVGGVIGGGIAKPIEKKDK